tara:strand:- start:1320 stop:1592 length:273 start_codon:yes stop_codon:yes gene_type:complete
MNKIEEFYKEAGAKELDSLQKKEARFTYYDMIGFADAYHSKQLIIADVSQQRELLKFFYAQLSENLDIDVGMNYITEEDIEECLKNFNCG